MLASGHPVDTVPTIGLNVKVSILPPSGQRSSTKQIRIYLSSYRLFSFSPAVVGGWLFRVCYSRSCADFCFGSPAGSMCQVICQIRNIRSGLKKLRDDESGKSMIHPRCEDGPNRSTSMSRRAADIDSRHTYKSGLGQRSASPMPSP